MNLARRERAVACPAVPRSRLRGTGVAKRAKRVCGTGVVRPAPATPYPIPLGGEGGGKNAPLVRDKHRRERPRG